MRRVVLFLLVFVMNSCSSQNIIEHQLTKCKILEIKSLDDGSYCLYVESNNEKSIIIDFNNNLDVSDCLEILKGKEYLIELKEIDTNFRGEISKYVLTSEKGTQTVIWHKSDGYPLLLYKANNINKLCIVGNVPN